MLQTNEKLNRFQLDFNKLLTLYFKTSKNDFSRILEKKISDFSYLTDDIKNIRNAEEILIQIYKTLCSARISSDQKHKVELKHFDLINFKGLGFEYPVIDFLAKKFYKRPELIKSAILHGSFATRDFVRGFSDLDLLIILNDKIFSDVQNLKSAKKFLQRAGLFCYKIDVLAHHEIMFLTEFDLQNYLQNFLPVEVYERSLSLCGLDSFYVFKKDDTVLSRMRLEKTLKNFIDGEGAFKKYGANPYDLKNSLANLMIVPSLVLGLYGQGVYKKFSFEKFHQNYPKISNKAINLASLMRTNWKQINFLRLIPNTCFYLLPQSWLRMKIKINRFFLKIIFRFKSKKMIKEFFILAEDFTNQIFNYFILKDE